MIILMFFALLPTNDTRLPNVGLAPINFYFYTDFRNKTKSMATKDDKCTKDSVHNENSGVILNVDE